MIWSNAVLKILFHLFLLLLIILVWKIFMKNNVNELCIIFGLYIKMIVCWKIHKDVIENAFLNNQLDELIHDTYSKHGKTGYYKQFCDKKMKIGHTIFW